MTDAAEVFWRAHHGLPRQAPGSEATTELLLRLAGPLPDRPAVLDLGCGTGPATVVLARETGGQVTAVDLHEPFLAAVLERSAAAGVAERVDVLAASMADLPIPPGSVDLIWAEGSAYALGFDKALAAWRPLLARGGVLVLTEAEWLTVSPAPGARAFWDSGYPAMRTTAGNIAAAQAAGWEVHAVYVLPDTDWDAYYGPLAERLAALRDDGVPEHLLEPVGEEITVRARHGRDYSYTGYVLRPR